jgi:predicted outer membrane repeat protein
MGRAQVTVRDTKLRNNTAGNGAAIYAADNTTVTIQSSSFEGNVASLRGGAIFAAGRAQVQVLRSKTGKPYQTTTGSACCLPQAPQAPKYVPRAYDGSEVGRKCHKTPKHACSVLTGREAHGLSIAHSLSYTKGVSSRATFALPGTRGRPLSLYQLSTCAPATVESSSHILENPCLDLSR